MTTKVIVCNMGPDLVNVDIGDRDGSKGYIGTIGVGEFREYYLHQHQSILLTEFKSSPAEDY